MPLDVASRNRQKSRYIFQGLNWAENTQAAADTCTIFPYDIAYTPISSSFSSSSFLSILTLPLLNIRESELISCSFNFAMLFCTEIRLRLPFRSQSHISVEFFWHRKYKRALQNNSNFPADLIRQIVFSEFRFWPKYKS